MILLTDHTFRTVAACAALIGITSGALGSFAVLRKESLQGDCVSHATLPGIVIAFLLTESGRPEHLLPGAFLTGLAAIAAVACITKRSRLPFDSALALVMAVFFGLGLVLLSASAAHPAATQAALNRFIYGQAAAALTRDIQVTAATAAVLLFALLLFWKECKLLAFDPAFAKAMGLHTGLFHTILNLLTVCAIVIGLQTVGAILMSAMLAAPAAAARQWTNRLETMTVLSAAFGAAAGVAGVAAGALIPGLPTGPAIVVCAAGFAIASLLFAPARGVLPRFCKAKRRQGESGHANQDGRVSPR